MTSAMVLPLPTGRGSEAAWTARVRTALRPEFTADRLVVDVNDPAYSAGPCLVEGCQRLARGHGMCAGHHHRWAKAGRPDVDEFVASTDPGWARQRPNRACRVEACGYGVARKGLCQLHAQGWERSGRPDFEEWLAAGPPPIKAPVAEACHVPGCLLWPQAAGPFCHAHHNTWRANGRPDPVVFAHEFAALRVPSDQVIVLARLPEPLRSELAYVIQCRHDERASRTPPEVVGRLVSFLLEADVSSLRDGDEQSWREAFTASGRRDSNGRGLLVYAHQRVADLAAGSGWEAEYPREVWQLRRLGHPGNLTLDFTRIAQPWLREATKRWTRQRLATGVGLEAVRRGLTAVTRLAGYLQQARIDAPQALTRVVLEGYLADLSTGVPTAHRRQVHIGQLRGFLEAVRQRGWAPLDPTAALFTDDNPPRPQRGPRAVAEHVMAQLEAPTAIAAWPDPAGAVITLILIRCGLRVGDATRLSYDCLVTDPKGAPYLRYVNHKMNREALVPLDEELCTLIRAQQARVTAEATAPPVLFPRPTKNPDRAIPLSTSTYRAALYRWLKSLDVRDRTRPSRALDPAPVEAHPRHSTDQPGCAPRGRAPHPGPRLVTDDGALRQAARRHRPPALGRRPQGRHHRRRHHQRAGQPAGRRRLDRSPPRRRDPGAAQRALRPADPQGLPPRQRVPDLPDVPDHRDPPARSPRAPSPGHRTDHPRRGPRPDPSGPDEPGRAEQPRVDHHRARTPRGER